MWGKALRMHVQGGWRRHPTIIDLQGGQNTEDRRADEQAGGVEADPGTTPQSVAVLITGRVWRYASVFLSLCLNRKSE